MNIVKTKEHVPVCTNDLYKYAEKNMKPNFWAYFKHGATNEITLAENEKAFKRFLFLPRMLRDVSKRSIKSSLLKSEIEHPFGFSPTACHKLAHEDGELATAKAAAQTGTPMILSILSNVQLEDVAACYLNHYCDKKIAPLWLQLVVVKDREVVKDQIKRAELSGFTAIVVTIDMPYIGLRYEHMRHSLVLPEGIQYANIMKYTHIYEKKDSFITNISEPFDHALTYSTMMNFLKSVTSLPIILKGILTVEDAKIAVSHGVDGIIVSNHGGRQMDSVPSTLESLIKIAPHIPPNVGLYMDGGVRSGMDVLKALALGAKTVFIGRPVLWALSYEGTQGVIKLINILRNELDLSLALCGISDVKDVTKDLVVRKKDYHC